MRNLLLTAAASVLTLGGLVGASSPALARDNDRPHEEREHRDVHRAPEWRDHDWRRDDRDRGRFHEEREEHEFHRGYPYPGYYAPYQVYDYSGPSYVPDPGAYVIPGYSFGIQGPRFSLYLNK
ncbi:MAG: hypothetical protein JO112_23580 [Planctomycetes bacterium]|nr:hypothetical protein [Planctomycetota bacterium]